MSFEFLNGVGPYPDHQLVEVEELAFKMKESIEQSALLCMIREVRRLQHALVDPQYLYAGGRVSRYAVMTRDAEIKKLLDTIKEMRSVKPLDNQTKT